MVRSACTHRDVRRAGRATRRNGQQHLDMLPGDPLTLRRMNASPASADEIGHLKGWPVHLFVVWCRSFGSSESRGLPVALR